MPILKDFRNTKEITLPGIPDSKVVIVSDLLVKDMVKYKKTGSEVIDQANMMIFVIKEWNLTDETGTVLPVNEESLGLLGLEDFTFLANQVTEFTKEEKKN